jgi:hypothetical protein
MKLDYPLCGMIQNCATVCEPECCGIDAYHFSPFHIASFLLRYNGRIDQRDLEEIRNQLSVLDANYGTNGASQNGCTIEEMNQHFSGQAISKLVNDINAALDRACNLVAQELKQSSH